MIECLRRKPRALLRARLQNDLLPNERWRKLWRQLLAAIPPDEAARVMVGAIDVATRSDDLSGVQRYLSLQLCCGDRSLTTLREHYILRPSRGMMALPTSRSLTSMIAAVGNPGSDLPACRHRRVPCHRC